MMLPQMTQHSVCGVEDCAASTATISHWAHHAESLCMCDLTHHADRDQADAVHDDAMIMQQRRGCEQPIAHWTQNHPWWAMNRTFAEVYTEVFVVAEYFAAWDAIGLLVRL
jgi:hypothetical protein